ncbi:hypothetical protein AYO39_00780 [Actinobacteria bacterium SCGC AG-212-D09]|nr:hypothetical protein AYO39_00780 [Actinobacteria bacterium SCGC AG-212-D09]
MAVRARFTARTEDLAVQELGDELLIYDRTRDVAHCLTERAARVWRACEGDGATLDELTDALAADGDIKLRAGEDAAAVAEQALAELDEKQLLAEPGGVSRRHALTKIAAVGAGALAAPLVVSAAVPRSAEAFKSPRTCIAIGSTCTTSPGQSNSYGSSTTNICCGPGNHSCSLKVGTGTGGCYCNSSGKCANCTASNVAPPATCGDGTCGAKGASNRCCCSGVCSSTTTGRCA